MKKNLLFLATFMLMGGLLAPMDALANASEDVLDEALLVEEVEEVDVVEADVIDRVGIQPLMERNAQQDVWRVTTNENSQIRVYLNYFRPSNVNIFPRAFAGVRALTTNSRRLRVNLRWYNDMDMHMIGGSWLERPNVVPVGQRMARNVYWGDQWAFALTRNGRFRTSAQRMIFSQTDWNTSTVGTVRQSRSWNMR